MLPIFPITSFVRRTTRIMHGIHSSYLFSIPSLGPVPQSSSFVTLIFMRSTGQARRMSWVGLFDGFTQLDSGYLSLARIPQKWGPWCWFIPWAGVLTLITWWRGSLPGFSPVKPLFSLFVISKCVVGRCLKTRCTHLVSHQTLPQVVICIDDSCPNQWFLWWVAQWLNWIFEKISSGESSLEEAHGFMEDPS